MQNHNIHIIKANDTLKSISMLFHLSEEEIKNFHNNYCESKDIILIDITNQKEIFLPRKAVIDKSKLVSFGNGNYLEFKPQDCFQNFEIKIAIQNGEAINELKYEVSVQWLKEKNNLHYFEINRISKIFINDEEVNQIADLLAFKTGEVLYPLQISVDENGKFNAVENLAIYKKRWDTIKEEVYKEFEGDIVDEYIEKIEKILDEPEVLTLLMKQDYFLRTIFFGVYQKYGPNYQIIGEEGFPIVSNLIEPNYEVKLQIDPLKDDYDLTNIEGIGRLKDERSKDDFIHENPFNLIVDENPNINNEGDLSLQFYLNSKTALPVSLFLECRLMLDEEKQVTVVVAEL